MTEQIPINAAATEQRLVEELTGYTPPLEEPDAVDITEPGDPEPIDDQDHAFTD
ncbi:MAG: hypothetical protein ABIS84_07865 [Arachnia sp.]